MGAFYNSLDFKTLTGSKREMLSENHSALMKDLA